MAHVEKTVDSRGVATITLNRPGKHNAFNAEVIQELQRAFTSAGADPTVRVILVAANGKSFCAGADAEWLRASVKLSREDNLADAHEIARMLRIIDTIPKPTVALVHGAVMGGGVGLIAACDIAVATRDAFFSLSEVKLGLLPAAISPYVIAAIGARNARRFFLTAERISGDDAARLGFVHEVVEDQTALLAARDRFVKELLMCGPAAIADCKALIRDVAGHYVSDELMRDTARRIADRRTSEEGQEGLAAFIEKRKPRWVVA